MNSRFIERISSFLGYALLIMLMFFIITQAMRAIFDTDIWLHLKTGKLILQTATVPSSDPYSFTLSGKHWNNHEWLFQIMAYLFYSFFDFDGLVFLQTFLIAIAFLLLFKSGFEISRHLITTTIISIMVIFATTTRFNLRPEILSLIFFVIFLKQLFFNRNSVLIYSLVVWQLIWVNSHGYFFLGPLLIFIVIFSELVKRLSLPFLGPINNNGRLGKEEFRRLIKVGLLSVLVCLINPQGLHGALYPFFVVKDIIAGNASLAFAHIEELKQPLFWKFGNFYGSLQFNLLILLVVTSFVVKWRTVDLTHVILYLLFLPFGLIAVRNIAFLNFIGYLIIIGRLKYFDEALRSKINVDVRSMFFRLVSLLIVLMGLGLFLFNESYPDIYNAYYDFETHEMKSVLLKVVDYRYPKNAVKFLISESPPGHVFNDFNSGAYLIFNAYPKYEVYIDGRTELYGQEFLNEYFRIIEGDKDLFDSHVEKYSINTVFLNNATAKVSDKLFKMIYENPKWQLVLFDELGFVFVRKTAENSSFIKEHAVDLTKWVAPRAEIEKMPLGRITPDPYLNRAMFFDLLGLWEPLRQEAQQALRILPSSGQANFYLGKFYYEKKQFERSLEYLRNAHQFDYRSTDSLHYLAKVYEKLGNEERALTFYERALESDPEDPELKQAFNRLSNKTINKLQDKGR